MLEANTDRSYFMIGAVIIAAVVIAGVTWLYRDVIFAEDGTGLVQGIVDSMFGAADNAIGNIDTSTSAKQP